MDSDRYIPERVESKFEQSSLKTECMVQLKSRQKRRALPRRGDDYSGFGRLAGPLCREPPWTVYGRGSSASTVLGGSKLLLLRSDSLRAAAGNG